MNKLLVFFLLACNAAYAGLLPDYDMRCNAMKCKEAEIFPPNHPEQSDYFNQEVPKKIHQIWFGNINALDKCKPNQWRELSEQRGYNYYLWSEDDIGLIKSIMSSDNFSLFKQFLSNKNWWSASDLLRYSLLKQFGGLYVDCDLAPPVYEGEYVNLEDILNFKGLTLWTEHHGRNVNATAIFVGNSFIMSPPEHPVLISLTDQIYENCMHWYSVNKNYDAMFVTGPFLLNKVLSGSVNIVPITYMKKFNCY